MTLFGNSSSLFSSDNAVKESKNDKKNSYKKQLEFANFLYEMGEYENATTEYLKINYFNKSDSITRKVALSAYYAENYKLAKEYLNLAFITYKSEDIYKKLFRIYEDEKLYKEALELSRHIENDNVWYQSKYLYLLGENDSAKAILETSDSKKYSINRDHILELMNREFTHKNYGAGTAASLFPGGGYIYTERYGDALFANIVIIPLAIISAVYYVNDEKTKAYVWGGIGGAFYLGSIYGGIRSVGQYNKQTEVYRNSKILENYNSNGSNW